MKLGLKAAPTPATFEELVDSITKTEIPVKLFEKVDDIELSEEELRLLEATIAATNNITDNGFEGEPDGII